MGNSLILDGKVYKLKNAALAETLSIIAHNFNTEHVSAIKQNSNLASLQIHRQRFN